MNKKLYSLMALGTFLFAVACSDNDSPISGSTSVPNMGNNLNVPQSPVLCSVMGVTDSLEALEKGCIWSPEMWGPTTGYRVRTGYDNGTNTSGIWTVSTYPENANVIIEWPGNATTEYDSMALADVIDKCGGSLCGKVFVKNENSIPDSDGDARREVYFDFYLAGKNASGEFESVDAHGLGGLCISYSGSFNKLQFIPDDSVAALMGTAKYETSLLPLGSNTSEFCFSWNNFKFMITYGNVSRNVSLLPEDVITSHLKGVRFVSPAYENEEREFKIVGISSYKTSRVSSNNLRPVRTDCEPISVASSFCECDFSDDRIIILKARNLVMSFESSKGDFERENGDASLSDSAKACIDSTSKELLDFFFQHNTPLALSTRKPCDNPLPQEIMCVDGTTSQSIEYANVETELKNKRATNQETDAIADSLFNHCLSL